MIEARTLFKWSFIVIVAGAFIAVVFWMSDNLWGPELISNYPQTLEYYPAFIATGMGVLLALLLQEALTASRHETRIGELHRILLKEMERMHGLVSEREMHHLDTQVWDSMINSGDVSLLPTNLQDELFEIYARARALNIETSKERDMAESLRRQPTKDTEKALTDLHILIDSKELVLVNALHKFFQSEKLGV